MEINLPPIIAPPVNLKPITDASDLAQLKLQGSILTAIVESGTLKHPIPGKTGSLFEIILKAGNQRFFTESATEFKPGQLLRIEVLQNASIRVLEVLQPLPPDLQAIVQTGLREALPLQQNPSILLNNLLQLRNLLAQFSQTPELTTVIRQIDQLLSSLPTPTQVQSPIPLKTSVANSGVFLEGKLQQFSAQLTSGQVANSQATNTQIANTQLKNAQIKSTPAAKDTTPASTVREALQSNPPLAQAVSRAISGDLKAQLLTLAARLIPLIPVINTLPNRGSQPSAATVLITRIINSVIPAPASGNAELRTPPPLQLANVPLDMDLTNALMAPSRSPAATISATQEKFDLAMSTVLRQIAATISRLQANQFSGLASQTGPDFGTQQSWHIELPVFSEGQIRTIQLIIERDTAQNQYGRDEQKTRQWNITLGFDFQSLGEFYATLRIAGNSVSTTFWSERPATLQIIRAELEVLESSLKDLGLEVNQLDCRKGVPPLKESRLEQRLVDIET